MSTDTSFLRRIALLVGVLGITVAAALVVRNRDDDPGPPPAPIRGEAIVVDIAFAMEHREAIEAAGADLRIFDFPGANSSSGDRFPWARDFGPLQMPGWRRGDALWDAINGGATHPVLEHEAVQALAKVLASEVRTLDLVVQGGNWLLLPDDRVITTSKTLDENPGRSRFEIESELRSLGVAGLIVIEPLAGELTRHADLVVNVDPRSGHCLVGEVWPEALVLIPPGTEHDAYRAFAVEMQASLDRTAALLSDSLGADRVRRIPQPLPYFDPQPDGSGRPVFPSFVNGLFVVGVTGETRYLYGISGDLAGEHYYAWDAALLDRYQGAVEKIGAELAFEPVAVPTGDLVLGGGSLHCMTVEVAAFPRPRPRAAR
ncbi:MAG: hypothetical protein VYE73_09230 [Acidobacteriota bacterium]|nr:hypothetical protein [Acidobacteriota bacterium]